MAHLTRGLGAEALVSRQLELWRVRQAMLVEREEEVVEEPHFGPYVTISRDFGSGGTAVARRVAEQLGWDFFDREIVETMAREAHLRENVFESLDERGRSKVEDWVRGLIEQTSWLGQDVYRHYLTRVLNTIALHGYAVLVGRGAHLLLPPEAGLRVKVTAPADVRAERVAQREGIPLKEARERVAEVDEERRLFLQNLFGRRRETFTDYDLALNSAYLPLETMVRFIVQGVLDKTGARPRKE